VETSFVETGHGECVEPLEHLDEQRRDRETGGAAECGEHEALGEELAHETGPTRAKRDAQGELAPAARRTRDEHAADVRARDQQHEPDAAHQHEREASHVVNASLVQQLEEYVPPRVGSWVLLLEPCCYCSHLGLGLTQIAAGCKSCDDVQVVRATAGSRP
jgi:hypothetical protein